MSNSMVSVQDISVMARAIGASRLFGMSEQQAMALMFLAQAEGRHPAIVARDYHIIDGRPSLKSDAMLARFQESGGSVRWHAITAECADATFSHPSGGELRISWTIDDARRAGLAGRKGPWTNYPRAMLRARLVSEGIRTLYPAVVCGTYTPEEVADFTVHTVHTPSPPNSTQVDIQSIESDTPTVGLSQQELADWIDSIQSAESMESLKGFFECAIVAAKNAGDQSAIDAIKLAKDKRKSELTDQ